MQDEYHIYDRCPTQGYSYKPLGNCSKCSKLNQRQFSKIITGDKTYVYYFEQIRTIGNKIRHGRRPLFPKVS
jgi:hypothetical protein